MSVFLVLALMLARSGTAETAVAPAWLRDITFCLDASAYNACQFQDFQASASPKHAYWRKFLQIESLQQLSIPLDLTSVQTLSCHSKQQTPEVVTYSLCSVRTPLMTAVAANQLHLASPPQRALSAS